MEMAKNRLRPGSLGRTMANTPRAPSAVTCGGQQANQKAVAHCANQRMVFFEVGVPLQREAAQR